MSVIIVIGYIFVWITFLFNIIISIAQAKRSYHLNHSESFYSLCLSVGAMTFSFVIVLIVATFDEWMGLVITFVTGILFSLFLVFNVIQYLYDRLKSSTDQKEIDFSQRESLHHELIRKIFHIILFFGIIALLTVAYIIIENLYLQGAEIQGLEETYLNYWGNLDGLEMWNINLDFGQSIIFLFFVILTTIFTMNEGARIGKWFYFPLRRLASIGIREKEKETVASYVYFSIGMVFAAPLLYPLPIFSIIGILCFADTAASLFGRRYGRHKIPFNREKSWEGAIGGIAVCALVTILLVGPIWGLAATVTFFIMDAITPVVPLSDNIGIPVAVTGVYMLLSVLQIPMYSIVVSLL